MPNDPPLPRVLLADDSAVSRALLRAQLNARGYQVIDAAGGREALAAARELDPDVVLLDLELPGEDGFAILEQFKVDSQLAHIPVVVISRRSATEDAVRGLERGAHDYLRKPVEPAELVARVHAAARAKALHDGMRRANAELARTALTDSLTGLANRPMVAAELQRLAARAERHGLVFGVLLLDVDGFRAVNDRHGHGVGDEAIRAMSERLRSVTRAEDVLGRWGGEEFVVLVNDAGPEETRTQAERLCQAVREAPLLVEDVSIPLTVSGGWVVWRAGATPDDLLRRAGEALHRAKASGGDRAAG